MPPNEPPRDAVKTSRPILLMGLFLALLIAVGWFLYNKYDTILFPKEQPIVTYASLLETDKNFAEIESLYWEAVQTPDDPEKSRVANKEVRKERFSAIAALFEKKLEDSSISTAERLIIQQRLVSCYLFFDVARSVQMSKQIAQDTALPPYFKAVALAQMADRQGSLLADKEEIDALIFEGSPYKEMYDGANRTGSYEKLYEYSRSLTPTAFAESRLAQLYALRLLEIRKKNGYKDTEETTTLLNKTTQSLANTEKYVTAETPNILSVYGPGAEEFSTVMNGRKAVTLARLQLARYEDFGDPSPLFESLMEFYQKDLGRPNESNRAFVAIKYTAYLAERYGEKKRKEIEELLSGIMTAQFKERLTIALAYESDYTFSLNSEVTRLGNFYPKFKTFSAQ